MSSNYFFIFEQSTFCRFLRLLHDGATVLTFQQRVCWEVPSIARDVRLILNSNWLTTRITPVYAPSIKRYISSATKRPSYSTRIQEWHWAKHAKRNSSWPTPLEKSCTSNSTPQGSESHTKSPSSQIAVSTLLSDQFFNSRFGFWRNQDDNGSLDILVHCKAWPVHSKDFLRNRKRRWHVRLAWNTGKFRNVVLHFLWRHCNRQWNRKWNVCLLYFLLLFFSLLWPLLSF